jgi:hypothetical protein
MDHPNIAKVLDGGLTADRRPFFVMELVNGQPLTRFCDEAKLTPRQRLELFVPVCQAVQHAHQKGVVHRDLKPSNILVTLYDGKPVPKVIDFGVAKATGGRLTEETVTTQFGAVVGTFEYMAPEQAGFSALDVDTRADIYSLGVLLYELLTGLRPFDGPRLRKAAIDELFRILRDEEPPRPSTKLSTDASLPSAAAVRGTDPKRLTAMMRGELDWIVMRCLEKDRNRRYESASALSRDVQRYLADEAVEARPPSAGYRVRKFVRRNRARVAVAAGLLVLLVGGMVATSYGLYRADVERQRAEGAERSAVTNALTADAERRKAEYQAASVAVDLDLKFFDGPEAATGLLRLARRVKLLPDDLIELRQFVMMTLFARGQDLARLVPRPSSRDALLSPDGRTMLGGDTATAGTLWDLPTGTELVRLWRPDEYGYGAEFSPDGRAVMAIAGPVARVWESPAGRRGCELHLGPADRHDAYLGPRGDRVVTVSYPQSRTTADRPAAAVVRLWDGATGRLVARLEHDGKELKRCLFSPDGASILTTVGPVARAWSAADGRLVQTLAGHATPVEAVAFSRSGARAVTCDHDRVYWWNTADWRPAGAPCQLRYDEPNQDGSTVQFLHDDVLSFARFVREGRDSMPYVKLVVAGEATAHDLNGLHSDGERVLTTDDRVYALRPLRRLDLPAGRRYPDEFRAQAVGGRFLVSRDLWSHDKVADLAAEKAFPFMGVHVHRCPAAGCSFAAARQPWPIVLPAPDLAIDPDTLDLWARVLVRGELDPATGFFVKHDEATWERNRQALLARPKPLGEFPFPGAFASDPLFWLRRELETAPEPARRPLYDRLVAAEPTVENYITRAGHLNVVGDYPAAVRAALQCREVATRTGQPADTWPGTRAAEEIAFRPNLPADQYELARTWYATVCKAGECSTERGAVLVRLGRHAEALAVLREPDVLAAAQACAAFMNPVAAADARAPGLDEVRTMLIALCELKLGHRGAATVRLARARAEHDNRNQRGGWDHYNGVRHAFLVEAESTIERAKP